MKSKNHISPLGSNARSVAKKRRKVAAYSQAEKSTALSQDISNLVILFRTKNNITQEELGSRMRINATSISRLESGTHLPSLKTLEKFAKAVSGRLKITILP